MGCSSSIQSHGFVEEYNKRQVKRRGEQSLRQTSGSTGRYGDGLAGDLDVHIEAEGVTAASKSSLSAGNGPEVAWGRTGSQRTGSLRVADDSGFSNFSGGLDEPVVPLNHPPSQTGPDAGEALLNRRVSNLGRQLQAFSEGAGMAWPGHVEDVSRIHADVKLRARRASSVEVPPSVPGRRGTAMPDGVRRQRRSVNDTVMRIEAASTRHQSMWMDNPELASEPFEDQARVSHTAPSSITKMASGKVPQAGSRLVQRGVSVEWLTEFFEKCRSQKFGGRTDFTTQEVVDSIVGPSCGRNGGVPYVIAKLVDMTPAEYYISHSWERPFEELVQCAQQIRKSDTGVSVWIDVFAIPQSSEGDRVIHRSVQEQVRQRLDVISDVNSVLLLLDSEGSALSQAWCQIEAHGAGLEGNLQVSLANLDRGSGLRIGEGVRKMDILKAKSPEQGHADAARRMVLDRSASSEAFNQTARKYILEAFTNLVGVSRQSNLPPSRIADISSIAESVLHQNGDLSGAVEMMEQTLEYLESALGPDHGRVVKALGSLITAQLQLARPQAALPLNRRALSIAIDKHGPGSKQACQAQIGLGKTLFVLGSYAEAASAYRSALRGELGSLKAELPAILGLAEALQASGDTDAAGYVLITALEKTQNKGSSDRSSEISEANITLLKTMGEHYKAVDRLDSAEEYYGRAVIEMQAKSRMSDVADAINLELASTLNSLAGICRLSGKMDRAHDLYRKSLALREVILPEGHPSIASSLLHVAAVQRARGKFEKAAEAYQEALTMLKKIRGPMHLDIAALMVNLAGCQKERQGKKAEAKALYENALNIRDTLLGSDHPDTLKVKVLIEELSG